MQIFHVITVLLWNSPPLNRTYKCSIWHIYIAFRYPVYVWVIMNLGLSFLCLRSPPTNRYEYVTNATVITYIRSNAKSGPLSTKLQPVNNSTKFSNQESSLNLRFSEVTRVQEIIRVSKISPMLFDHAYMCFINLPPILQQ